MYEAKTFDIPELEGISKESIDLHLGLYAGYVKHVNYHFISIIILYQLSFLKDNFIF